MQFVPVLDANNQPLMPCHPARARELLRQKKAVRRWFKGVFAIRLVDRVGGDTQKIAVGIDPGSKKEGVTVKSEAHTYLNIQADAVTWVKDALTTRREMRRGRRFRKTPCRKNRSNRAMAPFPPSTKARWQWKLRICNWLARLYPVSAFVVEDIKARTFKNGRKWNASFSPLEVGKLWFYEALGELARVETRQGYETYELRQELGLKKTKNKMADRFDAHCVDSWVLANWYVGGHIKPDNEQMLFITPLRFHRRQLHRLQPEAGGIRKPYGSTRSHGFKRGALVKHPKYGLCYVGGQLKDRLSLHSLETGVRLTQLAKPADCKFLAFGSWRTHRGVPRSQNSSPAKPPKTASMAGVSFCEAG